MPELLGRRPLRRLLAVSAAIASATALTLAGTSAASADDHTSFPGSKPTWATSANLVGAPPVDDLLNGQIQLRLHDEAGAEALAKAISTPGTSSYRHYVTPAAWIARYSPTKQEYARVVAYVKSYGLTITATPKDRLFVNYRGTTTQLNAAFSAKIRTYRHQGTTIAAPSAAPQLPTSVAADTKAVNLTQIKHVATPAVADKKNLTKGKADETPVVFDLPCSQYWTQHSANLPTIDGQSHFNTVNCGYTGGQLRSAYSVTGDGAGQTIGEVLWGPSPTIVQDVNRLAADTGVKPLTTLKQILPPQQYNQTECGSNDAPIEESLDIETMHGMAPNAKIVFSGASDCDYGVDAALSVLLDDHLSSVVSNSYGDQGELPIDAVQAELHQQWLAAAEGVGLYYSSGDDGDNTDAGIAPTADYFTTSPWVTAVGGTTTEIGKNGTIAVQTGWGNSYTQLVKKDGKLTYDPTYPGLYDGGAGGGVSTVFSEPWYQQGVVPSSGGRAEPDIAAIADNNTGLLTGFTDPTAGYVEVPVGGTSLASPVAATEAVLVQQKTGCALGFINPTIYRLAKQHSSAFTDVLPVKVDVVGGYTSGIYPEFGGQYTSLSVNRGWDSVTGLGSFSVPSLAAAVRH